MSDSEGVLVGQSIAGSEDSGVLLDDHMEADSLNEDPAVIVGMACRLPGDIRSPSGLWKFLVGEKSAQGPVPSERYNIGGYYHPDGSRSGSSNVPGGYFINEDLRQFDNGFFGINNLEATYMDPQQRKLLEVVYECLESSGTTMESLSGSSTGVYVGNFSVDYQPNQTRDPDYIHRYTSSGTGATIMSNRISHIFNLHGPSFTIDTACSSSIYALHQALNALNMGDCDTAIVASANMVLSPELHIMAAKSGVLSPTGTCHTFDASADGYGRAEGVNAIYVKRMSAALRDGNNIRAVIRGSATNASGRTSGISLPSGKLQEAVIRKAYKNAGLSPSETDYVECHGTGTPVGDPIEVDAVGRCFSPRAGSPLIIGSVKSNVGHSEGASGLTSILKVVTAFENGQIPPSQGIVTLNPKLILKERNLSIATKMENWPRSLRRASVNSFGYGGANAHLILESVESYLNESAMPLNRLADSGLGAQQDLFVLPVSAASSKALQGRIEQISHAVAKHSGPESLSNLAYTLTKGRDALRHRGFLLAKTDGEILPLADTAMRVPSNAHPFGFVFTGQGAQYAGMAKDLLAQSPHFRSTIRALDGILKAVPAPYTPGWTLEQTLLDSPATSRINEVTRSQPICTAVQIALVDLLRTWGIRPSYVVGHSSGEIGAAYAAGLLSASQAALVAYYRGYAVGTLRRQGAMLAAGLSVDEAKALIESKNLSALVRVACVNAPASVTIAGSLEGIEAVESEIRSQSKFVRKLETGGRAYHSYMMAEIGGLYEELLKPLFEDEDTTKLSVEAEMYSSVGSSPDELRVLGKNTDMVAYWRQNLEQPVQFNAALKNLTAERNAHLVEIGPHAALKGPIQQIRKAMGRDETSMPYASTLVRGLDANVCMKTLAGALFTYGHVLDWNQVNELPETGLKIAHDLGPYPWDYSAGLLWNEPRASTEQRNRKYIRHELLGTLALTGNEIDFTWRNILKPNEMPWIKDHKLENQVIFPAAAYLALAIEAVSQIKDVKGKQAAKKAFDFRNVSITAALNIPEENDPEAKDLEVHTTMSPSKLSGASVSTDWYDFSVSSWAAKKATTHCTGSIRVTDAIATTGDDSTTVQNAESFDDGPASRWYKQWSDEGFCFGQNFQSLTRFRTDSEQSRREAIGVTRLKPEITSGDTDYPVHPITIDSAIQAAIWSSTAGEIRTLKAWFPVFFPECRIQAAQGDGFGPKVEGEIHTRSEETGFANRRMSATLLDTHGAPMVNFRDVRIALYTGKKVEQSEGTAGPLDIYTERQPTLRVRWKPDVFRLGPRSIDRVKEYVADFLDQQPLDSRDDETMTIIGALVDLAGHKNPRMRVLELGGDALGYKADHWLGVLDAETAFKRCKSWHAGDMDEGGKLLTEDGSTGPFDVLLVPTHATTNRVLAQVSDQFSSLVTERGIVVMRKSEAATQALKASGFDIVDVGKQVLLAVRPLQMENIQERNAIFVHADKPSTAVTEFGSTLATYLQKCGASNVSIVAISDLDTIDIHPDDICVSLLEMEQEFLATISPQNTDRLHAITDVVTDLLWVTGANMLGITPNPNLTLSSGLSRALMLEQPALRFTVLDLGPLQHLGDQNSSVLAACEHTLKALLATDDKDDCEFIAFDGLLHISRYGPDFNVNSLFRRRVEAHTTTPEKRPLATAQPARLSVARVGVADTIHFEQLSEQATAPPAGFVDVEVKAVSLNSRDVSAMLGRTETRDKTTAVDISGVVTATGPEVDHVAVGDRVTASFPHRMGTVVRAPAANVHILLEHDDFNTVPALLHGYASALYAVNDRAHLRSGETVLVHGGTGDVGLAVITLARQLGAIVYTTADTPAKRDYLLSEMGIPAAQIFSPTDSTFVSRVMKATDGYGVDAIISSGSFTGDVLHDSLRCLAELGRVVDVSTGREPEDAGKLDTSVFRRSVTFTAFDRSDLYYARDPYHKTVWNRLVSETMKLYRAGTIQAPPTRVFDVSQVVEAYRFVASSKEIIGSVVLSMENPQARVPVAPALYSSLFDPEKVYLLIGCLGGLGRSLSRWMMNRGARRFVFLGRSGADKPGAQQLVTRLQKSGAFVGVVRGDISNADDVTSAVGACLATQRPIGGVVQAAMGLHEALFTSMSNKAWHTGIDPKWQGTWNLHNALEGHDDKLDFFLLTSSVSGTVGTATESNYCAANGFLDAFARWRRSQGKPAVSIGLGMISEVGYLHENPEIEALLLRKGIQPINEDEMLQLVDLALSSEAPRHPREAHLLTGLESAGIRKLAAQGFDVSTHGVLTESRASVLLASLQAEKEDREALLSGDGGSRQQSSDVVAAPWFHEKVPAALKAAFSPEADAESIVAAILRLIKKRFSSLILMPVDNIDDIKPLPDFGVDSMIASEFRTWFWSVLKVDVPFLDIMNAQKSLKALAEFVELKIVV